MASGYPIGSISLHYSSGTLFNLASKPPPCPSQYPSDGDSLVQVPLALHSSVISHVNPYLWSLGFGDPPCPPTLAPTPECDVSFSLLTPMLMCLPLHLLKTPQASPRTLRIFTLTLIFTSPRPPPLKKKKKSTNTLGPNPGALAWGSVGGRRAKGTDCSKQTQPRNPRIFGCFHMGNTKRISEGTWFRELTHHVGGQDTRKRPERGPCPGSTMLRTFQILKVSCAPGAQRERPLWAALPTGTPRPRCRASHPLQDCSPSTQLGTRSTA